MEIRERVIERLEGKGYPNALPSTPEKESIKSSISWTASLTFHVIMKNSGLHPLNAREELINAVKQYAASLGFNPAAIKSETITRTWRKMVEEGLINNDSMSAVAEEAHREFWR